MMPTSIGIAIDIGVGVGIGIGTGELSIVIETGESLRCLASNMQIQFPKFLQLGLLSC